MSRLADVITRMTSDAGVAGLRLVAATLTSDPAGGMADADFGDGAAVTCLVNPDLAVTAPAEVLVLVNGPLRFVAFRAPSPDVEEVP